MMKVLAVAVVLAAVPACAQAQGLVGDVVNGALGTADAAVHDVIGSPRHSYRGHRHRPRCAYRHGSRHCH